MLDQRFGRRTLLRGAGILGAASVGLGAACAGCAGDGDANHDELTFFFQANPEEADARLRIIEAFQHTHPDIRVRTVLSGPDPMQQMSTFCAGGKCPDVLMAWDLTYAGLADRGVLADLNAMLADDPDFAGKLKSDSIPGLFDTFTLNNRQYALPEQWSGNFLYYNKALFADAGLPDPPGRWDTAWTFAEFLASATALTQRDSSGALTRWGFVDTWVPYYSAGLFGVNNGTPWCQPRTNPTHLNFDDDHFLAGMQFYADLAVTHRVAPKAADVQSISTMDLFSSGRAAMALGGHWRYQTFSRADGLDFDLTVLPVGPNGHRAYSNIGTTGLAIAATSPRKQQAWEFIKFATGPEGQALIGASGLFVPVLQSALQSPGFIAAHNRIRHLDVLTTGPAQSGYLPVTPAWQRIDALMDRDIGPVLRGTRPATTLAGGLSKSVDQVLASP